jgi:acetyl esterase/lipase
MHFDPVNDVSIAIDWIENNGAIDLDAHASFVASGESSGAHLSLLAMLIRRDRESKVNFLPPVPLPPINSSPQSQSATTLPSWKCLNLVYGIYDISGTPSLRADGDSSSPLCGNDLLWMYEMYYNKVQEAKNANGEDTFDRQHPSVSALYANLSHMPPALFTVGSADPLLDDSLFMANKYSAYGNHVELAIYEGGEHGIGHFIQEEEDMGVRARRHTLDFMKQHLNLHKTHN